jgi:hypothetical protein
MTKQEIKDLINTNLQPGSKITAEKHKQVENALLDAIFTLVDDFNSFSNTEALPFEVREIDMLNNSITLYFEQDGKGREGKPFEKWAICNGNNGTQPRAGKVAIGYGGGYVLGATGGVESVILNESEMPIHTHQFPVVNQTEGSNGNNVQGTGNSHGGGIATPETKGGNQPHTNMQPYIVTLFIQRIPV